MDIEMRDRPKLVQESLGQRLIDAVAEFARTDIPDIPTLLRDTFSHIGDRDLRVRLAETLYGARWIYKLGLTLLTKETERAAHVRAQVIDYAAIAEAVLAEVVHFAISQGRLRGDAHAYDDPVRKRKPIDWSEGSISEKMKKRSLWWCIQVARANGMVSEGLSRDLDWLRDQRNRVLHLKAGETTERVFLNHSSRAFRVVWRVTDEAGAWKRKTGRRSRQT
ncbi:MAG: hypothetical protein AB7I45_01325 [Planctomycetota bacterium]